MAATYNSTQTRDIDIVRSRLADIGSYDYDAGGLQDVENTYKSDEEITANVAAHGVTGATRVLASSLATFFGLQPDKIDEANGLSITWGARAARLKDLITELVDEEITTSSRRTNSTTTVVNNIPSW